MSVVSLDPAEWHDYIESAKEDGHGIIIGGPDCLQLDLDNPSDYDHAVEKLEMYWYEIGVTKVYRTQSKSGNQHIHCLLKKPMDRKSRIFWQCALGSDRVRELLHWVRFREGMELEAFLVVPAGQKMELLFDFTKTLNPCKEIVL